MLTVTPNHFSLLKRIILFVWLSIGNLVSSFGQSQPAPATWQEQQREAIQTFYRLEQSNNYTESLSYADLNTLPMGIRKTIGGMEVIIAVSDIRLETTHSELTLFARVKVPQVGDDRVLFFAAQGIKLSQTGDIIGDAALAMMGDMSIPIQGNTAKLTLRGATNLNTGRTRDLTYVSVDCQGFRELGITADIEFSENLIVKADPSSAEESGKVMAHFTTVVTDWNDLLVGISLPPFEMKGLKDFVFEVKSAVFDFSDLRNDPATQFPPQYDVNYLIPGNVELWRGVFVKDLVIHLPKQFGRRTDDERVAFAGRNMVFDNNGISGLFGAKQILSIKEGSASGWRFSVDEFMLALEANHLTEAKFSGAIGLPVAETNDLGYTGIITANDEYLLQIRSLDSVSFDVFNARAELLPNSYVQLQVVDDEFKPEAMLHGSLNVVARLDGAGVDKDGKQIAEFKGIEFRSLHLKTDAPRFTAEYFGYRGDLKLLNFPVSINSIGLKLKEHEVGLAIGLDVNLSEDLFSGSTSLEFVGKLHEEKTPTGETAAQEWKYSKLVIDEINIDATVAEVFTVKGALTVHNNDPVYGDGYAGNVQLTFDKVIPGLNVKTRAIFGYKDFRYWFVDASVKLPGLGISVGPMSITGFAGGASNRMRPNGVNVQASGTGAVYKPDENTGLAVKAGVLFNIGSDNAMNGEASFEVGFNRHGGLSFIGFYGFGQFIGKIPGADNVEQFTRSKYLEVATLEEEYLKKHPVAAETLTKLKQYEPGKTASTIYKPTVTPGSDGFSAAIGIQYDFNAKSLHATFDLYVNAVSGLIRGTATGNRAGWAVLHIDPATWYMYLGTPEDRLGVKMGIGNILNVETGSYLMMGSDIPGSPPPPQQVADILNEDLSKLDYMRDLNALGSGRGFAFGSNLRVATGDLTFLILYANFSAGLGFDIMLKDYNEMQCEGRSGAIGFDGWYANGQAYAYLQGELGVKVNLWFLKAKIPIIKGAAAALLQAQLPNPVYFKGYMGVQFSVLGGLVSGSCRFRVTVGEKCELVIPGGSPLDFRMISDFTPDDKSEEVDIFAVPHAAFTMPVNKTFRVEDDHGMKTYRISLTEFSVLNSGKAIAGELVFTKANDGVSFYSEEVLPPDSELKARIKVGFEQYKNDAWHIVYTGGLKAEEILEVTFKTGSAPESIPVQNIQFAYPVLDQQFFLKGESTTGTIQLKRGQAYLFSDRFNYEIQLEGGDGTARSIPFAYNQADSKLIYTMPDLSNSQLYKLNFVAVPKGGPAQTIPAVSQQTKTIGEGEDIINVQTNEAADVTRADIGKTLLQYAFSTSRYNTFTQKVSSVEKGRAMVGRILSDVVNLQYEIRNSEPFDLSELTGTRYSNDIPLVQAQAILSDAYYQEDVFPVLYRNYPIQGTKLNRDVALLGVPPVKALPISTAYLTEVEADNYQGVALIRFPYIYDLPSAYKNDFIDLQKTIVNRFLGTTDQSKYEYIINGSYKFIRSGYYTIELHYVLPDGTAGTSAEFEYYNFIK